MATLENDSIIGMELINETTKETTVIENDKQIELIAKALASKTRRKIMKLIHKEPMDVSMIANSIINDEEKKPMTEANISAQIKTLEKAGLIECIYSSGQHGVRKISKLRYDRITIEF